VTTMFNKRNRRRTSNLEVRSYTKHQIMALMLARVGSHVSTQNISRGSTIAKSSLLTIAEYLEICNLNEKSTKHEILRSCIETLGGEFNPSYVSAGSTITKNGLYELYSLIELRRSEQI
jgi:hypothetical protein